MAKFTPIVGRNVRIQGRYADQDSSVATKYNCATCSISYYTDAKKPKCPLCDLEKRLNQTQEALAIALRELETYRNTNTRLAEQMESTYAIRGALDLLDDNDTAFLKTVLYQWKIDRAVTLRVTHGAPVGHGRKKRPRANGFVAVFRGQPDPVAHVCTSMGGLAIADYFEEGLNEKGHPGAMAMLLKGLNTLTPGAIDGT